MQRWLFEAETSGDKDTPRLLPNAGPPQTLGAGALCILGSSVRDTVQVGYYRFASATPTGQGACGSVYMRALHPDPDSQGSHACREGHHRPRSAHSTSVPAASCVPERRGVTLCSKGILPPQERALA